MARERDSQRSKVYRAEQGFWNAHHRGNGSLESLDDIRDYVGEVMETSRIVMEYGLAITRPPITIRDGRGATRAFASGGYAMTFPKQMRKEWIVLHELAHIIHHRIQDEGDVGLSWEERPTRQAGHGYQWASIYLHLTKVMFGTKTADGLKLAFRNGKVRYNAPRKRAPLTPEARAVLVERLATAREAKAAKAAAPRRRANGTFKRKPVPVGDGLDSLRELLTF